MYIHLKVKTKQKEEYFKPLKEGYFEVSVKEKPERNQANKRILELVKEHFNKTKMKIVNGHQSRNKLISIED